MIKRIAYDDKTGKEIESGLIFRLYVDCFHVDNEDMSVKSDVTDEISDSVLGFDMSEETLNDLVGLIKRFIYGEPEEEAVDFVPEAPKEEPQKEKYDEGKLIALYEAGWKQKDIALDLRVAQSTVSVAIKKLRESGRIE